MKSLVALLLCAVIPTTAFAAEDGYKVTNDGGSISNLKAGNDLRLYIESNEIRLYETKGRGCDDTAISGY